MTNSVREFIANAIVEMNKAAPDVDAESSTFLDQTCVYCGADFDIPADFVFDRRRAYYCDDCLDQ